MSFKIVAANDCLERKNSIEELIKNKYEVETLDSNEGIDNQILYDSIVKYKSIKMGKVNKLSQVLFIPEDEELVSFLRGKGLTVLNSYPKYTD